MNLRNETLRWTGSDMQTVLGAPDRMLVESRAPASVRVVRLPEWIIFAFLLYAPALTFFVPTPEGLRTQLASLNVAVILIYASLVWLDSAKPRLKLEVIRDWLPLGMILLAYREMGWFALPHPSAVLERRWVAWDRLVLGHGGRAVIECLGPIVPSVLETAYALVYALPPFALAVLYLCGRRDMADRFLTAVLFTVLLCYAQFPFWPSEPPRVVFAGLDLPAYNTIFRRFNLSMLGQYGIHTSVFPSAHVAGALSTAFGFRLAMPESKRVYRFLFAVAVLIAIATVYGRYHYLADAAYGAVTACMVPSLLPAYSANVDISAQEDTPDPVPAMKTAALPVSSMLFAPK
jgi:membrane-associated phospholipid phosphatase